MSNLFVFLEYSSSSHISKSPKLLPNTCGLGLRKGLIYVLVQVQNTCHVCVCVCVCVFACVFACVCVCVCVWPYTSAKHPWTSAKEPYTFTKEPYTSTKEPYTSAKEPYTSTKEPYASAALWIRALYIRKRVLHTYKAHLLGIEGISQGEDRSQTPGWPCVDEPPRFGIRGEGR